MGQCEVENGHSPPAATDSSQCGIKDRGRLINMEKQARHASALDMSGTTVSGVDACLPPDIQPLVYASAVLKFPGRKLMNLNGSWMA